MKRMIYGLTMAAAVLLAGACEKEKPSPDLTAQSQQGKKPTVEGTAKSAITINWVTPLSSCRARVCDSQDIIDQFMYNMIEINVTHNPGGTVNYVLYEMTPVPGTPFELGNKIATFQCSLATTRYSNDLLNNGAKLMVYAMHPTDTAPLTVLTNSNVLTSAPIPNSFYSFVTLLNYEGAPGCGGNPNG